MKLFFDRKNPGWWNDLENQKIFLEEFAKVNGVKILEDWYEVLSSDWQH